MSSSKVNAKKTVKSKDVDSAGPAENGIENSAESDGATDHNYTRETKTDESGLESVESTPTKKGGRLSRGKKTDVKVDKTKEPIKKGAVAKKGDKSVDGKEECNGVKEAKDTTSKLVESEPAKASRRTPKKRALEKKENIIDQSIVDEIQNINEDSKVTKESDDLETPTKKKKASNENDMSDTPTKKKKASNVNDVLESPAKKRKVTNEDVSESPAKKAKVSKEVSESPAKKKKVSKDVSKNPAKKQVSKKEASVSKKPTKAVKSKSNNYVEVTTGVPKGWKKRYVTRQMGKTAGSSDLYYIGPDGSKFRSKPEVLKHLKATNSKYTAADFEFGKCKPKNSAGSKKAAPKKDTPVKKKDSKAANPKKNAKPVPKSSVSKMAVKNKPADKSSVSKKVVKNKPAAKSSVSKAVKNKPVAKSSVSKKAVKNKPAAKSSVPKKAVKAKSDSKDKKKQGKVSAKNDEKPTKAKGKKK